jgi:hypothetical protein
MLDSITSLVSSVDSIGNLYRLFLEEKMDDYQGGHYYFAVGLSAVSDAAFAFF